MSMRGGEKVLEQFCFLFPEAEIYSLAAKKPMLSDEILKHRIKLSLLGRIPFATRFYKSLLPFHPIAISSLRMSGDTKLVICSDASMIKGIRIPDEAILVCYCHSPPRYLWEMQESYKNQTSGLGAIGRWAFDNLTPYCRRFDHRASQRVDYFIANSRFVQTRIEKYYGKPSHLLYPPVDVDSFDHRRARKDFYLVISELAPYKRIDIAIDAFNLNGRKLVVIGDGSERSRLEAKAKSNITFLGRQKFGVLKEHFETCRAFVFPGVEDFGITPVEAQAAGSPVIAFGEGGALETVIRNQTGCFFNEQNAGSLNEIIEDFELSAGRFSADVCRENALKFHPSIFRQGLLNILDELLESREVQIPKELIRRDVAES